jgi:FHS family Na+ dependent glucose MFS transporter 1
MQNSIMEKEENLQKAGNLWKTAAYYTAFVALGLTTASLGPTLPGLAENTHTQLSQISYLFTARSLGYLLGSLVGGRVYDRRPGHPILATVLLVMAGSLALVPLIQQIYWLTAVLLALGFGEGALDVGGNTMLVWVHRHDVSPFMNGLHFFFGVGAFVSPIIVAQAILMSGSFAWAYWGLACLTLPAVFLLLKLPSPASPVDTPDNPTRKTNVPLIVLIAALFFLYVGAEVSFGGWIFTYATAFHLANLTTAAYLTSAFWGALTVGRLLGVPMATRYQPGTILLFDLIGCLLSVAIILIIPGSFLIVAMGTLGVGFSMATFFPTLLNFAERRMAITGKITGWFFVGSSSGGMFLPWLIGQRFEAVGPQVTMIIIFIDLLLTVGIFAALFTYSERIFGKAAPAV